MNISEINNALKQLGVKVTNSQIKKAAASLGYEELYEYPNDQAQRIIDSLMTGRKVANPQQVYQDTTQTVTELNESALALRAQNAIVRGQQLAAQTLQNLLVSELELTRRSYEANLSQGMALLDQSIEQCWPIPSLPEISDRDLVDQSIFASFMHPELSLGVAR